MWEEKRENAESQTQGFGVFTGACLNTDIQSIACSLDLEPKQKFWTEDINLKVIEI
jgi:hypothetical protein